MKKLLVLTMVLVSFVSYGQNKITGFGKLQLGMSTKDIPDLSNSKIVTTSSEFFSKVYENRSRNVYETIADTTDRYTSLGSLDNRVRVFQIGKFNLTDNIEVSDVNLKFFNNKLFEIEIKDSKVDELLTTKYGEPKKDYKEKENTFVNGYGAKFIKKDQTWTHTWETGNVNLSCWYTLMSWYNDKGQERIVSYTMLKDNSIGKEVEKQVEVVKTRINKRIEDSKKNLVSGL